MEKTLKTDAQTAAGSQGFPSPGRAWYAMTILLILYTISYIDRMVLSLLVDPIRATFGISETQLSLLHGFAFAFFHAIFAIPIARMADLGSRVTIISVGSVVWTAMTSTCGLAQNYWQIFLFRMGVGIGEASLTPAAYSLTADYFDPKTLPKAMSFYSSGIFIGSGLALLFSGAVISFLPALTIPGFGTLEIWQSTFIYVAVPGMVVLAIFWATVKEPPRQQSNKQEVTSPTMRETWNYVLTRRKVYLVHWFGFAFLAMVWAGLAAWQPSFFIRTFGWSPGKVGLWLGLGNLIFAPIGILTGGWLARRLLEAGRKDANILVGLVAAAGALVFGISAHVSSDELVALSLTMPYLFFISMPWGAAPAALQVITPNRMRSTISALFIMVINLMGIGAGPTIVALFTDFLFKDEARVGYSIALTLAVCIPISMVLLNWCRSAYVAEVEAWEAS